MRFLFDDESFSYEALRTTCFAVYHGADLGEVIAASASIPNGDETAWHRVWSALADRSRELGELGMSDGDPVSAREAFLRASNYYRTAEFYRRDDADHDPEVKRLSGLSRQTFAKAAELLPHPVRSVAIPYAGTTLPGYLFLADDSGAKRPTILFTSGFDSTLEESYFVLACAAVRRGYNVLAYDGPGQGAALRNQSLRFRPDWEKVVGPVVDFAIRQPEVDERQLTLFGYSFGGHLVARAAAFEPRLAALILNDGIYSYHDTNIQAVPPFLAQWIMSGRDDDANAVAGMLMPHDTALRWALRNGVWTFGAKSVAEYVRMTKPYTLEGVADKIRCPTLVCDAEDDFFFRGQPQRVYEALTCKKDIFSFGSAEGASEHCHVGALTFFHQRIFSWLDRTLARS
jgi:pimeloyl-ACP methyl ester carboxylesterase